jgi:hypothetical protein
MVRWRPAPVLPSAFASLLLTVATSTTALAQSTPDSRVDISIVGGYQTSQPRMSQTQTFELYSEQGSLTTTYTARRQPVAEAGVTVRVWRKLTVGIAATHFHDSGSAQVNASLPNPLAFSQPRELTGTAAVSHTETGMNVFAGYWIQRSRLDIIVSGGPSVFRVDQDFVSDVVYTEVYPYDTVGYEGASEVRQRKSTAGGNIGGEVGWRLVRHFGIAAAVRYSRATATFTGTSAPAIVVGGLHVGGGVRLLF